MSKHGEPWRVDLTVWDDDALIRDCEELGVGSVYDAAPDGPSGHFTQEQAERARRIVAAVNATASIPTEALEAGGLRQLLDDLQEWHDQQGGYDAPVWRRLEAMRAGQPVDTTRE